MTHYFLRCGDGTTPLGPLSKDGVLTLWRQSGVSAEMAFIAIAGSSEWHPVSLFLLWQEDEPGPASWQADVRERRKLTARGFWISFQAVVWMAISLLFFFGVLRGGMSDMPWYREMAWTAALIVVPVLGFARGLAFARSVSKLTPFIGPWRVTPGGVLFAELLSGVVMATWLWLWAFVYFLSAMTQAGYLK